MKLEAGKKYVDREGGVHGPLEWNEWGVQHQFPGLATTGCWTERGTFWTDEVSPMDLVAEHMEPTLSASPDAPQSDYSPVLERGEAVPAEHQPYALAAHDAFREVTRAKSLWPRNFASMHEGYAVIAEELNKELWEIVCQKQPNRDLAKARAEALQVAAMAIRFAVEVCGEEAGRT